MTQAQHSTLALGITAVGILAAGAFNVWEDRFVAAVVFLGAIPLVATMVLIIWAGQILGMLDIGSYLLRLETAIGQAHPDAPETLMTWERSISRQNALAWPPNYAWHYLAVVSLFALLILASIILGASRAYPSHEPQVLAGTAAIIAVVGGIVGVFAHGVITARRRNRHQAREVS